MDKDEILGYECKHAIHCPAISEGGNDLTLIKEIIHFKNGTKKNNIRLRKNYERPFYVTRKEYQDHEDKKEHEALNKLQKFTCTQSHLTSSIAKAVGRPGVKASLRQLARSPYLYGADITSTAILKKEYLTRWPDLITPNSVAAFDIETDVVEGHEEPIMVGLTFGNKRIISIVRSFLGGMVDVDKQLRKLFTHYLPQYENPEMELIVDIAETPGHAINNVMKEAHKWQPDFISIWNIAFDLPRCVAQLEKEGFNLKDVFSDPSIPGPMRHCKWVQGNNQKKTASGKITPIHWTEQWHTLECPASFYFVDAACIYRRIRIAKGMEAKYSLDYILDKNLGIRKLKFDDILEKDAPDIRSGTLGWHQYMQKNHKLEYAVYNLFDCISLEELDKKTTDISSTFSILCEHSDFKNFASQPRRIADDMHFFVQQYGEIFATTSDKMVDDNDEHVISMREWMKITSLQEEIPE